MTASVDTSKHRVTTTIEDPLHPGEKWTIETVQDDGELLTAFLARHMLAVIAMRKILGGK
jgi:hypothetical protein